MVNTLTGKAGLKLGPVLFETLVRHYFERVGHNTNDKEKLRTTQLRKDELLYDEAFTVVKTFLDAATKHTVEELQGFSNQRTPSPPWVHLVRLAIPMSCCDESAKYLITALGGEEVCKRVVGGTKWWQVRGIRGVDAEWITARKDWEEAKRKYKAQQARQSSKDGNGAEPGSAAVNDTPQMEAPEEQGEEGYLPDMDEMRCILYAHGGGYYFGSVDQERYAIQRFARKINGRVLAVNYRLAPQYPFPCAIQDLLAAYLFLIRPPEGASHRPVKPSHIICAGDSAGGGMTLALLQVIRDAGLPAPAGGVLISPWCDLTHSFPSIHTNTATDIIPLYGLSVHKPSTLWPPPSDELTTKVHNGLRSRIRQFARLEPPSPSTPHTVPSKFVAPPTPGSLHITPSGLMGGNTLKAPSSSIGPPQDAAAASKSLPSDGAPVPLGTTARMPTATGAHSPHPTSTSIPTRRKDDTHSENTAPIFLTAENGEQLSIGSQIQLYTSNDLLTHPLVSGAMSYLGGLPPLLVIVGDKEVLRDEGIYSAHKAANPDKYPIREEQRDMYPALKGIEERHGPTKVHLQAYDDSPHILPILFPFTTPAKFCYRAVATFCKHVTGMRAPSTVPNTATSDRSAFTTGLPSGGGFALRRPSLRGLLGRPNSASDVALTEDGRRPRVRRSLSDMMRRRSYSRRPVTAEGAARPPLEAHVSEEPADEDYVLGLDQQARAVTASAAVPEFTQLERAESRERAMPATSAAPEFAHLARVESPERVKNLLSPASAQVGTTAFGELKHATAPPTVQVPLSAPAAMDAFAHIAGGAAPVHVEDSTPMDERVQSQASTNELAPQIPTIVADRLVETPPRTPTRSPPTSPLRTPSGSVSALAGASSPPKKPSESSDVAGPRFKGADSLPLPPGAKHPGDPSVYQEIDGISPWVDNMIRERVSTQGVIRPLEPPHELAALALPPEFIGVVSELAARRYLDGTARWDEKFKRAKKQIAKERKRNLERSRRDPVTSLPQLQALLLQDDSEPGTHGGGSNGVHIASKGKPKGRMLADGLKIATGGSWTWAWALEEGERPPPSSIAARRDTDEARALARIADTHASAEEHPMSGNNLWGMIMGVLTAGPDHSGEEKDKTEEEQRRAEEKDKLKVEGSSRKRKFTLPRLFLDRKGATAES